MLNNNFAIVFPGQGSQELGMLAELARQHSEVNTIFTQASEVLGYDLWDIIQNGPVDKLNQTEVTQPALLSVSYAIWRVFKSKTNVCPKIVAGHSLGEYSALVASDSIRFQDAVKLVSLRGEYMQAAVPAGTGAMAAVLGLDDEKIQEVLDSIDCTGIVEIANLNAIGQTVVAGHKDAVIIAVEKLKASGAKLVKLLEVSVPSHCSLMQPAAEQLVEALEKVEVSVPNIEVLHNYSVSSYNDIQQIKEALIKQLTSPVRWVETIMAIADKGIDTVYEFGPGSVLTKLNKRINKNITGYAVNSPESFAQNLELVLL